MNPHVNYCAFVCSVAHIDVPPFVPALILIQIKGLGNKLLFTVRIVKPLEPKRDCDPKSHKRTSKISLGRIPNPTLLHQCVNKWLCIEWLRGPSYMNMQQTHSQSQSSRCHAWGSGVLVNQKPFLGLSDGWLRGSFCRKVCLFIYGTCPTQRQEQSALHSQRRFMEMFQTATAWLVRIMTMLFFACI